MIAVSPSFFAETQISCLSSPAILISINMINVNSMGGSLVISMTWHSISTQMSC